VKCAAQKHLSVILGFTVPGKKLSGEKLEKIVQ